MITTEPRHDWLSVGAKYAQDDMAKQIFSEQCKTVEWHRIPCDMPFSQGYAIREMIRELCHGKAQAAGWSNCLVPFTLLAVRKEYIDGVAEVFAIDSGCEVIPVLVKFYENN